MSETCETCNAYKGLSATRGVCRANPPTPLVYGMEQVKVLGKLGHRPIIGTNYPEVGKGDWCRAHQPATEAAVFTGTVFDPSKMQSIGETNLISEENKS